MTLVRRIANSITNNLLWWLVLGVIIGLIWQGPGIYIADHFVGVLLGIMIFGVGICTPLSRVKGKERTGKWGLRKGLIIIPLIILGQFGYLSLLGYLLGLGQLVTEPGYREGLLIVGASPAEVTSALLVLLAGGDVSLATLILGGGVVVCPFITPLLLRLTTGQTVQLEIGDLVTNLTLTVLLPMLAGLLIRHFWGRVSKQEDIWSGVAALSVIILLSAVASKGVQTLTLSLEIGKLLLGLLILNLGGYFLGWLIGLFLNWSKVYPLSREGRGALIFTSGMREFGIATALALTYFNAQAATATALFGIIMMLTSASLASRWRGKETESTRTYSENSLITE